MTTSALTGASRTLNADLLIEALFVSDLQPSQAPSIQEVEKAVDRTIQRYGSRGCAATMAGEFGDHPDIASSRMRWARETVRMTYHADRRAALA